MTRKRVGILVFPDVEVLDFCGPFEVFSVTRLSEELRREEPATTGCGISWASATSGCHSGRRPSTPSVSPSR